MALSDPSFPPLMSGHAVRSLQVPFAEACRGAQERRFGAGDLVWSRSHERAALAIVLEPEVDSGRCLQMAPLMLVAAGDCLGALLPSQVPISYCWPDRLLIDGAEAGRLAIAHATVATAELAPDWLVVGIDIRISFHRRDREPGEQSHRTALAEEGGGDVDRTRLLETLAAHLMSWLHTWQERGFRPVHDAFMERLAGRDGIVELEKHGRRVAGAPIGLDEEANLLLKPVAGAVMSLRLQDWTRPEQDLTH